MTRLKIYLAGPDVFLPDAKAVGERKKAMCAAAGFIGLFPLDNTIKAEGGWDAGCEIAAANEALIREADILVANITPFRGPSCDQGTAYEIGYARALGKPIYAYSNDGALSLLSRMAANGQAFDGMVDAQGMLIENFYMVDNLMITAAYAEFVGVYVPTVQQHTHLGAFERCLKLIRVEPGPRPFKDILDDMSAQDLVHFMLWCQERNIKSTATAHSLWMREGRA